MPAVPKGAPATPFAPANPASFASRPAASSKQNRLSDAEAPAVPNRSYALCEPPPGVVKERLVTIGSTFVMGAILVGFFIFWVSLGWQSHLLFFSAWPS